MAWSFDASTTDSEVLLSSGITQDCVMALSAHGPEDLVVVAGLLLPNDVDYRSRVARLRNGNPDPILDVPGWIAIYEDVDMFVLAAPGGNLDTDITIPIECRTAPSDTYAGVLHTISATFSGTTPLLGQKSSTFGMVEIFTPTLFHDAPGLGLAAFVSRWGDAPDPDGGWAIADSISASTFNIERNITLLYADAPSSPLDSVDFLSSSPNGQSWNIAGFVVGERGTVLAPAVCSVYAGRIVQTQPAIGDPPVEFVEIPYPSAGIPPDPQPFELPSDPFQDTPGPHPR